MTQTHLHIGAMIFPGVDQIDFTGPFEVLSRVPDSTFHILAKTTSPLRDTRGLVLTPERTLAESLVLDVLHIPGGYGVDALMEDHETLCFLQEQSKSAKFIFSVCTGALLLGAAGLLKGRRATTHWAALDLLEYFGAIPVNERVVIDGNLVTSAGVTAGIDGALRLVSLLRGDHAAQVIQLYMQYAPQPPFNSGSPQTAPPEVLQSVQAGLREFKAARLATARRISAKLDLDPLRCSGK
jgi:cyclohexyl-isocyanide hydratase